MRDWTNANELRRLVEQATWANRRWIEFVHSVPEPEPRPRELVGHIVASDRVWFERIAGEQQTLTTFDVRTKEDLLAAVEENRRTFERLIDARLPDVVHFRRASGEEYHARVIDILYQLLTHGYHHRGQLAAHYAAAGARYPNTDHINYLIEHRL